MMKALSAASHHLLISLSHIGRGIDPRGRRRPGLVLRSRRRFVLLALAGVALGLTSVAAARPRVKEVGRYDVTISGFYSGSGMAVVTSAGVTIRADLTDEDGNTYKFQSQRLSRDPDRHYLFRGEGTLGGKPVTIDGRVDSAD